MNGVGPESPSRLQKVLVLYGTRPEVIKMAPVVRALEARPDAFEVTVCTTAQHREAIDQMQPSLGVSPDLDLDLMRPRQRLNALAARVLSAMDEVLERLAPDRLLVQGDTTSAAAAALAAFHCGVRVGHVEAGLRTDDLARPFPEEANRRLIDLVARDLFAPTERAAARLRAEGAPAESVHLTGNTVVDALHELARGAAPETGDEVLVTVHRRESFGRPIERIFQALVELAERHQGLRWVYPVHPNPEVAERARRLLGGVANLELHPPFDYPELVRRLLVCRLVLTDSGGIQEEAPTFGKPVLVLRDTTERPEGIDAGVARLVGTETDRIVAAVDELLSDDRAYAAMAKRANPYGDGRAAERIAAALAGEPYEPFRADGAGS